jgi:hypothetical protein
MKQTSISGRRQGCMRCHSVGPTVSARGKWSTARSACLSLGVALWTTCALADEVPGARPGDEALSCAQIYAQGQAESQREQEQRNEKTQAMRRQQQGFTGLLGTAIATGGLVGGNAVQKSAEDLTTSQLQMADTANQPNPRKERLRQLWTQKRCAAPGDQGGKPADDAMSCAQIAAEMAPYAQQVAPNAQAVVTTQRQLTERGIALGEKQRAENNALTGLATAGALDPTGMAKRAYMASQMVLQQKHTSESQALLDSPQAKQAEAQRNQLLAQGQQLQADGRLQQLMLLGHQKGCDRK